MDEKTTRATTEPSIDEEARRMLELFRSLDRERQQRIIWMMDGMELMMKKGVGA